MIRRASHAGTWYSGNKQTLQKELGEFLNLQEIQQNIEKYGDKLKTAKSFIVPHAGYFYSG